MTNNEARKIDQAYEKHIQGKSVTNDKLIEKLGIEHARLNIIKGSDQCHFECTACAIEKAIPIIRADERAKVLAILEKEYPAITVWPCWKGLVSGDDTEKEAT